jgi:hypothetical protein
MLGPPGRKISIVSESPSVGFLANLRSFFNMISFAIVV